MIKVIIAITTYNLEDYIGQALDSVLMQKTNFNYKIIVGDDCSTDRTPQILQEYHRRYPSKVEVLLSDKNLGSLANSNRILDKINCEYFSFLDGDDYWLTDDRLQKQVDFLDKNKEFSMYGANTQCLRGNEFAETMLPENMLGKVMSFKDYTRGRMRSVVHTSSILFRNTIFINGLPQCFKDAVGTYEECALRGEDFRRILHLKTGPIYIENQILSIYRIHEKGIWQGSTQIRRNIESAIGFNFYCKFFKGQYDDFFSIQFENSYRNLMIYLKDTNNVSAESLSSRNAELLGKLMCDVVQRKPKWFLKKHGLIYRIKMRVINTLGVKR